MSDFVTKDSGERKVFSTGSVRDTAKGKGRFDLVSPIGLKRVAQLYERGAVKYGERNWEKGQCLARYLDSAMRHLNDYLSGKRDEDHIAAVAWNALGFIHTEQLIRDGALPRELDDIGTTTRPLVEVASPPKEATPEESPSLLNEEQIKHLDAFMAASPPSECIFGTIKYDKDIWDKFEREAWLNENNSAVSPPFPMKEQIDNIFQESQGRSPEQAGEAGWKPSYANDDEFFQEELGYRLDRHKTLKQEITEDYLNNGWQDYVAFGDKRKVFQPTITKALLDNLQRQNLAEEILTEEYAAVMISPANNVDASPDKLVDLRRGCWDSRYSDTVTSKLVDNLRPDGSCILVTAWGNFYGE